MECVGALYLGPKIGTESRRGYAATAQLGGGAPSGGQGGSSLARRPARPRVAARPAHLPPSLPYTPPSRLLAGPTCSPPPSLLPLPACLRTRPSNKRRAGRARTSLSASRGTSRARGTAPRRTFAARKWYSTPSTRTSWATPRRWRARGGCTRPPAASPWRWPARSIASRCRIRRQSFVLS